MIKEIRNVAGVSVLFIVGFIFLVAFLEYRFDGDYYEKEDCFEVTITGLSREKISDPGKKYQYMAEVRYYTDSGHEKTSYMYEGMDKKTDIGDKFIVVKDQFGTINPVKRDWITWKYIETDESNNTLLFLSLGLLFSGVIYFILIPMKHEIIVCCIMAVSGILLKIYSLIHEGALELAIGRIGFGILIISILMMLIVRAAIGKVRTGSGLSVANNNAEFKVINNYPVDNKSSGILKRITSLIGNKISGLGNKKYTYLGISYFIIAVLLVGIGIFLIWGRGEYSGYKYVKAVVIDVAPFHTYKDNEVVSTRYSAEVEFYTDAGEKRTYITGAVFDKEDKDFYRGDELEVGYKGNKATLLTKNEYTGKYEAYNSMNGLFFMVAGFLILIGIYVITKMTGEVAKRIARSISWILFGISFEFSYVVLSGSDKIVWLMGIFTLVGVIKLIRAFIFATKRERKGRLIR